MADHMLHSRRSRDAQTSRDRQPVSSRITLSLDNFRSAHRARRRSVRRGADAWQFAWCSAVRWPGAAGGHPVGRTGARRSARRRVRRGGRARRSTACTSSSGVADAAVGAARSPWAVLRRARAVERGQCHRRHEPGPARVLAVARAPGLRRHHGADGARRAAADRPRRRPASYPHPPSIWSTGRRTSSWPRCWGRRYAPGRLIERYGRGSPRRSGARRARRACGRRSRSRRGRTRRRDPRRATQCRACRHAPTDPHPTNCCRNVAATIGKPKLLPAVLRRSATVESIRGR